MSINRCARLGYGPRLVDGDSGPEEDPLFVIHGEITSQCPFSPPLGRAARWIELHNLVSAGVQPWPEPLAAPAPDVLGVLAVADVLGRQLARKCQTHSQKSSQDSP